VIFVGLGSNLLVRDGGVRGTVVCTSGALNELSLEGPGRVRAEAGVACNKVARFCAKHGLVGAEFLAGIPGTMGGALAMNAGAFGGETWSVVDAAQTLDRHGTLRVRDKGEFRISYRHVDGAPGEWFTAAYLNLPHGDAAASEANIKALLAKRNATQPTNTANAGSTFRNPPGDYAARLIEAAGLKGFCIGGACVSEKHANFIVNTGDASAADIEALIEHVKQTVKHVHGVELVREVHVVGETQP
jgi:UDP-N-acetylmuramate dehydrogenase